MCARPRFLKLALLRLSCDADLVLDLHSAWEALLHLFVTDVNWPDAADLARELGAPVTLIDRGNPMMTFKSAHALLWKRLRERFPQRPIPPGSLTAVVELRGQRDVDDDITAGDAEALFRWLCRRGVVAGDPGAAAGGACAGALGKWPEAALRRAGRGGALSRAPGRQAAGGPDLRPHSRSRGRAGACPFPHRPTACSTPAAATASPARASISPPSPATPSWTPEGPAGEGANAGGLRSLRPRRCRHRRGLGHRAGRCAPPCRIGREGDAVGPRRGAAAPAGRGAGRGLADGRYRRRGLGGRSGAGEPGARPGPDPDQQRGRERRRPARMGLRPGPMAAHHRHQSHRPVPGLPGAVRSDDRLGLGPHRQHRLGGGQGGQPQRLGLQRLQGGADRLHQIAGQGAGGEPACWPTASARR